MRAFFWQGSMMIDRSTGLQAWMRRCVDAKKDSTLRRIVHPLVMDVMMLWCSGRTRWPRWKFLFLGKDGWMTGGTFTISWRLKRIITCMFKLREMVPKLVKAPHPLNCVFIKETKKETDDKIITHHTMTLREATETSMGPSTMSFAPQHHQHTNPTQHLKHGARPEETPLRPVCLAPPCVSAARCQ